VYSNGVRAAGAGLRPHAPETRHRPLFRSLQGISQCIRAALLRALHAQNAATVLPNGRVHSRLTTLKHLQNP
jgi:hypothetical protein